MASFDLLYPVADAAFKKYAVTAFEELPEVDQTVIMIWSLQGEVNNGGFDQFYFNSSGDHADQTVAALERIGARTTAALVLEGNGLFPTQPPPKQRQSRISELETFSDNVAEIWDRLEEEFYSDPDGLENLLVAYLVRKGVLPSTASGQAEQMKTNEGLDCAATDQASQCAGKILMDRGGWVRAEGEPQSNPSFK